MGSRLDQARARWRILKTKSGFRDSMLFLIFVCVSAVIWVILAFNDSAQDHFNVKLQIVNTPDSVTFISDLPEKVHVVVSDKGTTLWRNGYLKHPMVTVDFKEYASDGVLRYSYSDLQSALKETFGGNAQITSVSLDSLQLFYTTSAGKKVPIVIDCDVYPASGSTIDGSIKSSPASVYLFSEGNEVDTIHYVTTEKFTLKDLTETTTTEVKIKKIRGVRSIPSSVTITVPIEPLVKKEAMISLTPINVPEGEELLLFPSKVPVEYYVAMRRLSEDDDKDIELLVDYDEIRLNSNGQLNIHTGHYPDRLKNLILKADSVEYAIVKE